MLCINLCSVSCDPSVVSCSSHPPTESHLHSGLPPLTSRQMVYSRYRDSVVLLHRHQLTPTLTSSPITLTNAPSRHGRPSTSPQTTSLTTSVPPAVRAISSKPLLLSSPMVHMLPGRSSGRGRYLPLPVPESRPTHPDGMDARNPAIIGHGCTSCSLRSLHETIQPGRPPTLPCNASTRSAARSGRTRRGRAHPRIFAGRRRTRSSRSQQEP